MGTATAYFANQRGRDPLVWFMLGMLLGFFGLLLLFLLPPVAEEEPTQEAEYALLEQRGELASNPVDHSYMIKEWYYYDNNKARHGPVRFEKLKSLWQEASIDQESFVWCEGMENWKQIENIQGLYTHLQLAQD